MNEDNDQILSPALGAEPDPANLLEQLAAKRTELADTKETNVLVPGYDREPPLLMVRYRLLETKEFEAIGNRIRRETKNRAQRQLLAAVDTFVAACVGFYYDIGEGPLPLTYNGEHITSFGPDLAEAMRFADKVDDPNNSRSVVFGLFGGNDVGITAHNYMLNRWFADTSIDVNSEFLEGNL